jgi:catalase-peroxidase
LALKGKTMHKVTANALAVVLMVGLSLTQAVPFAQAESTQAEGAQAEAQREPCQAVKAAPPSRPEAKSPQAKTNQFWWPERLDLSPLRQHQAASNPLGEQFNYAEAFQELDLAAVKHDLKALMTDSQDWWPADYGHYGPFFIRMAWHSAGTYRQADGRGGADGGQQRFEPLNSWPDNANLDKARRLLWPVKQKYGARLSWADLMVLAGNVGLESMGFKTYGFAGGRVDDWEADLVYWGPETEFLANDQRYKEDGQLEQPLAASVMGLIYVNPEGPNRSHDPQAAAERIRETFGRMAMNDEETVALIAGGHTLGKVHGAHKGANCLGPEPAAAELTEQGFGWDNSCGKGHSEDTVTSGLEGAWTKTPVEWSLNYLENLFAYEWEQVTSPGGAIQWRPTDRSTDTLVPDAHVAGQRHAPMMLTTDLALKVDPSYRKIAQRFLNDQEAFELAFAKAWFKLTHRDLGPKARYLGPEVPEATFLWQDPLPTRDYALVDEADIQALKKEILKVEAISLSQWVRTAWAAAASYRDSDKRGGANGARLRLEPQNSWAVNAPESTAQVLEALAGIQQRFNAAQPDGTQISLADLIVLAGNTAIEQAAHNAGYEVNVPFTPGRVDALQSQTDPVSFAHLEPRADGFVNYYSAQAKQSPATLLVDKASQLTLTAPEMTVLVGGLRTLNANADASSNGVLTDDPTALDTDFFVNLLDMSTRWEASSSEPGVYQGVDRATGELKWTATSVDLIFGSQSELRAVAEVYASQDAGERFVRDFIRAWSKVMTLDRFDLAKPQVR